MPRSLQRTLNISQELVECVRRVLCAMTDSNCVSNGSVRSVGQRDGTLLLQKNSNQWRDARADEHGAAVLSKNRFKNKFMMQTRWQNHHYNVTQCCPGEALTIEADGDIIIRWIREFLTNALVLSRPYRIFHLFTSFPPSPLSPSLSLSVFIYPPPPFLSLSRSLSGAPPSVSSDRVRRS